MASAAMIERVERRRDWPMLECVPPPSLEVLDNMPGPNDGVEYSNNELYRAIASLRQDMEKRLGDMQGTMQRVVYMDVFTATMQTVAEREAGFRVQLAAAESKAESARAIAMWAIGLICASVVGAVVVAVVAATKP